MLQRISFISPAVVFTVILFGLNSCAPTEEVIEDAEESAVEQVERSIAETTLSGITSGDEVRGILNQTEGWVEETLSQLSLEEKVAQMMAPRINAHYMSRDAGQYEQMMHYIEEYGIGGITFFSGDVHELATLIQDFQEVSDIPLLISSDFERGVSMRIRRATMFPVAMAIGATGDPTLAYRMARATAREGRALGVHQNFAPVVDVNNNPDNPVINVRSFGEDPELVGELARAYTLGLHDGGMISTGKHFPGHGDTDLDSHVTLPVIDYGRDRLEKVELKPFRNIIEHGVMSIMTAHIAMPGLTGSEELPATLSREILKDLLRGDLNFEGLIVTDAMDMYGIELNYSRDNAALKAVKAGADIVLLPPDPATAIDAVVAAIRLGEIEEEQIDRSVRRILSAKKLMGLHEDQKANEHIRDIVGNKHHQGLARDIARRAVTLVRNEDELFPLDTEESDKILLVTIADREQQRMLVHRHDRPSTTEPVGQYFNQLFRDYFPRTETVLLDPRSNKQEVDSLIAKAEEADKIIAHSYVTARSGEGDLELEEPVDDALKKLMELDHPMGVVSFGDPYFIRGVPEVEAYLSAWAANEATIEVVVETLRGENNPTGRLPVNIPGFAEIGDGLGYDPEKKEEELPDEVQEQDEDQQ